MEGCITNYVKNLPESIKDYIYAELERSGRQCVQYFYEYLMTTMAEALSQGLFVVSFKVHDHWKNPLNLHVHKTPFTFSRSSSKCWLSSTPKRRNVA